MITQQYLRSRSRAAVEQNPAFGSALALRMGHIIAQTLPPDRLPKEHGL